MKKFIAVALCASFSIFSYSQVKKEITLSKESKNKIPYEFYTTSSGEPVISMEIKGTDDNYRFENYVFDAELKEYKTNISEASRIDWKKVYKSDYASLMKNYDLSKSSTIVPRIGGTNSFTVLNQALYVRKMEVLNLKNKKTGTFFQYTRASEPLKLKDEAAGKFVAYSANNDYVNGNAVVLVTASEKSEEYQLLIVDTFLNVKTFPVGLSEPSTLVFECLLNENGQEVSDFSKGDWYLLFAPKEGSKNPSKYTLLRINNKAEILQKSEINMPAAAVIVYNLTSDGKSIFITGGTFPKEKYYSFKPYRDIPMTFDGVSMYLNNYLQQNAGEECSSLVIVKQTGDKTDWISTTPVKEFKSLAKAAEGGKAIPYKGQFIKVTSSCVAGNYFAVTGQQVEFSLMGKFTFKYYNAYTFLVDYNTGKINAQYTLVTKSQDDKYGIYFQLPTFLKPSSDGKKIHWVVLENEARKEETTDFHAFINGYQSFEFIPCYYPVTSTIDVSNLSQSKYNYPGDGEYKSKSTDAYLIENENNFLFLGFQGKDKVMMYKYDY